MEPESEAKMKWKQYVCENSSELNVLKRQLQTAYNRKVLENEILFEKSKRLQEKKLNDQAAELEKINLEIDDQRRKEEERERYLLQRKNAAILQHQIHQKMEEQEMERYQMSLEAKLLSQKIAEEELKEKRFEEQQRMEKKFLRMEQEDLYKLRQMYKEQERQQEAEMEKQFQQMICRQHNSFDEDIAAERERKAKKLEEIKLGIMRQLEEIERTRKEKEAISIHLMCVEKEENERLKSEKEQRDLQRKRDEAKQKYDDISKGRKEKIQLEKKLDSEYAEEVKNRVQKEEELERNFAKQKRRVKTAVQADNQYLMALKREQSNAEKASEMAILQESASCEAARLAVIQEERLRLLLSFDEPTLQYLPRNCLSQDDIIKLKTNLP